MLDTRSQRAIAGFARAARQSGGGRTAELDVPEVGNLVEAVLERTGYRAELAASTTRRTSRGWTT